MEAGSTARAPATSLRKWPSATNRPVYGSRGSSSVLVTVAGVLICEGCCDRTMGQVCKPDGSESTIIKSIDHVRLHKCSQLSDANKGHVPSIGRRGGIASTKDNGLLAGEGTTMLTLGLAGTDRIFETSSIWALSRTSFALADIELADTAPTRRAVSPMLSRGPTLALQCEPSGRGS